MVDLDMLADLAVHSGQTLDTIGSDLKVIINQQKELQNVLIADDANIIKDFIEPDEQQVITYELPQAQEGLTTYEQASLHFAWAQTVLGIFILVALMLSLGVQLWNAFSEKWRG